MEGQRVPEEDVRQEDGEKTGEGEGDRQEGMRRGEAHARARSKGLGGKGSRRRHHAAYTARGQTWLPHTRRLLAVTAQVEDEGLG